MLETAGDKTVNSMFGGLTVKETVQEKVMEKEVSQTEVAKKKPNMFDGHEGLLKF